MPTSTGRDWKARKVYKRVLVHLWGLGVVCCVCFLASNEVAPQLDLSLVYVCQSRK